MREGAVPTIKGIFVMSHVRMLERALGEKGLLELERRFGKSVHFRNAENVPVSDEVKIIEHVLDLVSGDTTPAAERARLAGELHFKNFSETPLGKLVLPVFRSRFKKILLGVNNIAGHVFRGVTFTSKALGEKEVRILMANNDYPIDHFKGFFAGWLAYSGLIGSVTAHDRGDNRYEYTIKWR